ncbi:MAG: universal stress protein [Candidatus Methylomirabilis sp.]|nr:universal stress protein [Candidatus Methylomirabilis sp.]
MSGIPSSVYAQRMPGKPLAEQRAALRDSLFSSLEALVPEEARAEGRVTTEIRVVEAPGVIQEAICQDARTQGADLIVMASHGHSGIKHLLLGSSGRECVKVSRSPRPRCPQPGVRPLAAQLPRYGATADLCMTT